MEYQIIPSILVSSQEEFLLQIHTLAGIAPMVQIDIADGIFVDGKTWVDPAAVTQHMTIPFELHMMVHSPLEEIHRWKNSPLLQRIIFHYEAVDDISMAVKEMKTYGKDVCVCINPDTTIDLLEPVIDHIESVQCMSVYPGKQGQQFIPDTLQKITTLRTQHPTLPIAADGAVNKKTLPQLITAGANRFGPGSAIWQGDPVTNYKELCRLMELTVEKNT